MKNKAILLLFLLVFVFASSCEKKSRSIDIPFPQNSPFYDFVIPSNHLLDYVYRNKIKSIDLVINGDTIRNFQTFDREGRIKTRKDFNGKNESVYEYENGYLIRIKNPARFFRVGFIDEVSFSYRDNKVHKAQAYFKGQIKTETFFIYDIDSITTSTKGVGDHEPFQLDAYKYRNGQLLYEVHRRDDDVYEINNSFRNDSLIFQRWKFVGYDTQDIDSINADGLISSSLHVYGDGRKEKTRYIYADNMIQEFRYSDGESIASVVLLLNKFQ